LLRLREVSVFLLPLGASNWVRLLTELIGLTTKSLTQNEMKLKYRMERIFGIGEETSGKTLFNFK
jgi:hypothetical protein